MKKLCDRAVDVSEMKERVVFTGFISEKEIDLLYRLAQFFIYPFLYEGSGIPILEAMKAGTPVITSNITCHLSYLGNIERFRSSRHVGYFSGFTPGIDKSDQQEHFGLLRNDVQNRCVVL